MLEEGEPWASGRVSERGRRVADFSAEWTALRFSVTCVWWCMAILVLETWATRRSWLPPFASSARSMAASNSSSFPRLPQVRSVTIRCGRSIVRTSTVKPNSWPMPMHFFSVVEACATTIGLVRPAMSSTTPGRACRTTCGCPSLPPSRMSPWLSLPKGSDPWKTLLPEEWSERRLMRLRISRCGMPARRRCCRR